MAQCTTYLIDPIQTFGIVSMSGMTTFSGKSCRLSLTEQNRKLDINKWHHSSDNL